MNETEGKIESERKEEMKQVEVENGTREVNAMPNKKSDSRRGKENILDVD